jgi:hypothetical protein
LVIKKNAVLAHSDVRLEQYLYLLDLSSQLQAGATLAAAMVISLVLFEKVTWTVIDDVSHEL